MKRFGATVPGALLKPERPSPSAVPEEEVVKLQRERDATMVKVIARETYDLSEGRMTAHDFVIDEIAGLDTYPALHVGVWLGYGKRIGQKIAESRKTGHPPSGMANLTFQASDAVFMAVLMLVSDDALKDPWDLARRLREGPGEEHWRDPKAPWYGDAYEEWQTILSELADVLLTLLEGEPRPRPESPLVVRQEPVDTPWPAMPMETGDPKRELLHWGSEIAKRTMGMPWSRKTKVIAEGMTVQREIVQERAEKAGVTLRKQDWEAWGHVLTSMVLVAAHWSASGYPTLRPTHKLAASLMATHIPKELVPEVRMPWPTFLVEVPEGILPKIPSSLGGQIEVRVVGLATGENDAGQVEVGLFIGSAYQTANEALRRTVHVADIPMPNLAELADLKGFAGFYDPALVRLIGRFLLNMMIEVDSPSYRSEIARGPNRPSSPKKGGREKGALPSSWVVEVRRDVKLDARKWVTDYVQSKGTSPSVQTLVRGHRKRQPYGPKGMSLRRWIHVEPYWRGPEDAPVVARTMVMDGQAKTTGGTP